MNTETQTTYTPHNLTCTTHDRPATECDKQAREAFGDKNFDGFTNCDWKAT